MQSSDLASLRCPVCSIQPVEATAKATWVRGFLLSYQVSSRTIIGCVPCVRTALLSEAARSALLGWFSISAIFINPLLIAYNLVRAATIGPNPDEVLKRLEEVGFDPSAGELRSSDPVSIPTYPPSGVPPV